MAVLLATRGPLVGRNFPLGDGETVLGRDGNAGLNLESLAVSRRHARIWREGNSYFITDLGSSNGTYLNGQLVHAPVALSPEDELQIGPYIFTFRLQPAPAASETDLVIREEVSADPSHHTLYGRDPARLLEAVLEIGQQLARSLEPATLLDRLLEHLFKLFPNADRGMVLFCEGDEFAIRAHRCRDPHLTAPPAYSRTIIRRTLEAGVGLLSEDPGSDSRFRAVATVAALNVRSVLCVPLLAPGGRRLGALQLDCLRSNLGFGLEDLQLLTAIGLHVSSSLENAALHAELLREERLRHDIALARLIQQGFLPAEFPPARESGFELFARVRPASEVSGDLYDFALRTDGRLAFLVADVSGKGMPAALLMVAVRTLARHPATTIAGPAEALRHIDSALAADNRSGVFVTMVYGVYDPKTGEVVLASAAHPMPLVRRQNGHVDPVSLPGGPPLGLGLPSHPTDYTLQLQPGETLLLYTDGLTEAHGPNDYTQFGIERLKQALRQTPERHSARDCAAAIGRAVDEFAPCVDPQDDQTLLLLRRVST